MLRLRVVCPADQSEAALKILDPTVSTDAAEDTALAKRVGDLDGKVLGLLHNGKVNGDRPLRTVSDPAYPYDVQRREPDVTKAKKLLGR